jgi:hypothetical protein
MKKQINIFDCNTRLTIIASQYFTVKTVTINFDKSVEHGNSIIIYCHFQPIADFNPCLSIDIAEHELKYGTDLIYSRFLKKCIEKAIELKIYDPTILVM